MATVAGCTLFGAICGSTTATAATFASVSVQEMRAYKYRDDLIGGVIASSGGIGILIPPSVIFIVYGIFTQQSIGTLFLSGILPGLLVAFLFVLTIYIWCKKNPAVGPKSERAPWKARLATLPAIIDIIIIFVIVMGGMLGGFFTPTEGGAVGAFAVLVVALITRKAGIKDIYRSVLEGLVSSCMVLVIVAGATVFGHFLAVTNIPTEIATWVGQLPLPREMVLAMILLVYLIGGCVIDALALIILTVPIFYPVILALKFDPIWFGSIIVLITMMGVITPPVGVNSYVVSGISKIELQTVFKGVWPFLIALVIATILLIAFPQIALFIPTLLGK
jgi:tripartite ATP-independent transporter DctM subunit